MNSRLPARNPIKVIKDVSLPHFKKIDPAITPPVDKEYLSMHTMTLIQKISEDIVNDRSLLYYYVELNDFRNGLLNEYISRGKGLPVKKYKQIENLALRALLRVDLRIAEYAKALLVRGVDKNKVASNIRTFICPEIDIFANESYQIYKNLEDKDPNFFEEYTLEKLKEIRAELAQFREDISGENDDYEKIQGNQAILLLLSPILPKDVVLNNFDFLNTIMDEYNLLDPDNEHSPLNTVLDKLHEAIHYRLSMVKDTGKDQVTYKISQYTKSFSPWMMFFEFTSCMHHPYETFVRKSPEYGNMNATHFVSFDDISSDKRIETEILTQYPNAKEIKIFREQMVDMMELDDFDWSTPAYDNFATFVVPTAPPKKLNKGTSLNKGDSP